MAPKKSRKKTKSQVADVSPEVHRLREVRSSEFSTAELHTRFECHVTSAQSAYLNGDSATAEKEATAALQIKPTPSIFALLSVIAESKGQFDRASDFRLLQAFLARDALLWEELLHDFLAQQLFYKSVVCLQRMSALEQQNPARYRALQFQLADLLIGLGEIRRATHVLVPLWNSSKCRDFEVFALLSSLYFQLGKWSSLQRLISSSLKNSFHITLPSALEDPKDVAANQAEAARDDGDGPAVVQSEAKKAAAKHLSKRVRFFGVDNDEEAEEMKSKSSTNHARAQGAHFPHVTAATVASAATVDDDFNFDDLELSHKRAADADTDDGGGSAENEGGTQVAKTTTTTTPADATAARTTVRGLYGDSIDLVTPTQKRNFMTLVNVHAELLNESGKFAETVQLLEFAATALRVQVLDLPPDLLARLGTAYAFLGGAANEQLCREIFRYLLETCSMDEYGDVLLDVALSLQKVGMHPEAYQLFDAFARHYQPAYRDIAAKMAESQARMDADEKLCNTPMVKKGNRAADGTTANLTLAAAEHLRLARQQLAEFQAEYDEMRTVVSAAYSGSASSLFALRRVDEAESEARKALEVDPTHLQARLLLGKIYFSYRNNLRAAISVLTPKEGEPALQRIQLGASLVRVFSRSRLYVEAIALGVSMFEIILASSEDGDTESVAPGSLRRSAAPLLMPTMSRATSAIVPASTLAGTMGGGISGGSTVTGSVRRLSTSLAASIRVGTSVYQQQATRRGRAALTTTVYGASAAASVAAGWGREDEEEKLKDSSTIFRFHRKRRPRTARKVEEGKEAASSPSTSAVAEVVPADVKATKESEDDVSATMEAMERRRSERREAVTAMDAGSFWESPADDQAKKTQHAENRIGGNAELKAERGERKEGREEEKVATSQARKRDREEEIAMGSATTIGEKDRSLQDLEAFAERLGGGGNGDGVDDTAPPPESFELPTLDEISKRFDDPAMTQLFLEASSNEPRPGPTDEGAQQPSLPFATGAGDGGELAGAGGLAASSSTDRVTFKEAVAALGRVEFMNLTVTVVDSYSALGKFTEAKEFAFLALSRIGANRSFGRMGASLERPLRLALLRAAMAAGHSEDAFRVGLRLLQEDQAKEERTHVIELMHGVLNRCEDRSSILYRVFTDGACDAPLFVLLANRYFQTRSYTRVLNLYLVALQERPKDIFLNFVVGLAYLLASHQKATKPREALVSAGVYYLSQYQSLLIAVDPARTGEALYNSARAMHFLRLQYLCVPLYQRIAQDLAVPERCSLAVQRAAQLNLYYIHAWESGNRPLALSALPHVAGHMTGAA